MDKNPIDPENPEHVKAALERNPRLLQFLKALERDVGQSVMRNLLAHPPPRLAALVVYKEGEHNVSLMGAQVAKDRRVACQSNCWWCCTKPVQVTAPEVLIIADAIEDWPEEQKQRVITNARAYMVAMAGKQQSRWVYQRFRCPLLGDDGNCTVYEARPLICRAWTSTSAQTCQDGYNKRWASGTYEQVFEYFTVVQWLAEQLRDKLAGPVGELEQYVLAPALLIALTTENVVQRWIDGEDLFASAKWRM
jgi:Fe-S-cluster containining protein